MAVQQTQLMLILDNISLEMPCKATVYDDVMNIWTKALTTTELLVSGAAQSIYSGEVLLGLSAWHLYPDICVIGDKATTVDQKDDLVQKGGLMTIGLRDLGRSERSSGISWSMPLASLRYYGEAVMSHGGVGSQSTRVSFDRLIQVAIGSMISGWEPQESSLDKVLNFLIAFGEKFESEASRAWPEDWPVEKRPPARKSWPAQMSWPAVFSNSARKYSKSSKGEREQIARFVALGRRRYGKFMADMDNHPSPYFELSDPGLFLRLLKPEATVSNLRHMASTFSNVQGIDRGLIHFLHPPDAKGDRIVEYASLIPQPVPGTAHTAHRRWVVYPAGDSSVTPELHKYREKAIGRSIEIMSVHGEACGLLDASTFDPPARPNVGYPTYGSTSSELLSMKNQHLVWSNRRNPVSLDALTRYSCWPDSTFPAEKRLAGWQIGHSDHCYKNQDYTLLFGSKFETAVFVPCSDQPQPDLKLPLDYVMSCLVSKQLQTNEFCDHFEALTVHSKMVAGTGGYFESLITLARAAEVYNTIPEAEVDLGIVSKPLWAANWARAALSPTSSAMNRPLSLSCVSLFDSGHLDIDVEAFEDVLAVSTANSLYATEIMFCDPFHVPARTLRHVTGNIGKPGLALLLSPKNTSLREPDLETWHLVNHADHDGNLENNFEATSLHLSLTGYEQSLNLGRHGARDKEAFYVEAVVSAHDHGNWVADLNILQSAHLIDDIRRTYRNFNGVLVFHDAVVEHFPANCGHSVDAKKAHSLFECLTSIDSWYEYLDLPKNAAVVRAHGNWVARLAFATIPLPEQQKVVISSEDFCWTCIYEITQKTGTGCHGVHPLMIC